MRIWMVLAIVLSLIGTGFLVAGISVRGYLYIAAVFFLMAISLAVFYLAPDGIKRVYFVILSIGLIYFFALELLILSNSKTDNNGGKSYLIVLGAAVEGDQPSLSLRHRLQAAEDYLVEFPNSKAVLSGGKGSDELISESECMMRYLSSHRIRRSRLITEDKSTSTNENLIYSKHKILNDGGSLDDVAIVSSPYHLYRAKMLAKQYGYINPEGVAAACGYPIYTIGMYIREAIGLTSLWVFGE